MKCSPQITLVRVVVALASVSAAPPARAQILPADSLRVSAQTLSSPTTRAMFGRLPKKIEAAAVQICNETQVALTVPLARIVQEAKLSNNLTILPHDAAFAVIAASQGSSTGARILRGSLAAIELASIASGWSGLGATVKETLISVALSGHSALGVLSTAVPTHTFLIFDHETLPDPLQLGAAGSATACAPGVQLIESDKAAKSMDFSMPLPRLVD